MVSADTNRVSLSYEKAASFGAFTGGALAEVRYTSEDLREDITTVESREIRADRQVVDILRTDIGGAGGFNIELSYGAHEPFIENALMSTAWGSPTAVLTGSMTISAASSDNSYNTSATWTSTPAVGTWVRISGFAAATNNGWGKVVSATTTKIVVTGIVLTAESEGATVSINQGGNVVNGTTFAQFNFEKKYEDLTNEYARYLGYGIDGWSLDVPANGVVTGRFDFIGKVEQSASATAGTGTITAAPTGGIMTSVANMGGLVEGGAAFSFSQFSMQLRNNLRRRIVAGTLGAESLGTGEVGISGTLRGYFASKAIIDKALNQTNSSLSIVLFTSAAQSYVIDLPRVRFTAATRLATGKNADVMADMRWSAFRHSTENVTIRVAKFN